MTSQEILELIEVGKQNFPAAKRVHLNENAYKTLLKERKLDYKYGCETVCDLEIKIVPSLPDGKVLVGE